jgi:hypothetical protein
MFRVNGGDFVNYLSLLGAQYSGTVWLHKNGNKYVVLGEVQLRRGERTRDCLL